MCSYCIADSHKVKGSVLFDLPVHFALGFSRKEYSSKCTFTCVNLCTYNTHPYNTYGQFYPSIMVPLTEQNYSE